LKGTVTSVDCSHPPSAVLSFSAAGTILKLKTADYKTLLLIGADQFSCEWNHRAATVNYKAGVKGNGDLVSLELH
jgi:hypothetical protein